ncbi:uncharacterized protein LOC122376153 [Amphibalanus amphitrite]|uniref:uncharacterized protein LOC122376153 n=1 Tax=Amphibalanus amphitrite TaxID=1232801 RepID=UPI001C90C1FE|nr:uncharacterized protein LOC122376153 [Amphibalanus amphitrite]
MTSHENKEVPSVALLVAAEIPARRSRRRRSRVGVFCCRHLPGERHNRGRRSGAIEPDGAAPLAPMEYLSYQPDQPPPPCLKPESVQLSDPDTGRLLVAPESERPEPNCPLQITENTPTGDRYQGQVLGWRWEGLGSLTLPSGVRYEGQFRDGRFHGTGTLHFPSGSQYEGQWDRGVCTTGLYTFADGLSFSDQNWKYCQYPDRRYWSEIQFGIRPAGRSQLTDRDDDHPAVDVPAGMFDAGDGVYDPKCRTVYDYGDRRKIKRVVTDDDHQWIMSRCRRGGDTFMGRREELHQDLAPLVFHGGHSKESPELPEELRLEDLIGEPERPQPPSELAPPPFDVRERSADVVREVLRSAQRVATSVRSIVSSAAGRVTTAEEEARQLVRDAEKRADSTSSTISSLMDEARRRLGSQSSSAGSGSSTGTGTGSDWSTTASSDELTAPPDGPRRRRVAHAALTDSSSGESMTADRSAGRRTASGPDRRTSGGPDRRTSSGLSVGRAGSGASAGPSSSTGDGSGGHHSA